MRSMSIVAVGAEFLIWVAASGAVEPAKSNSPLPDLNARLSKDNIRFIVYGGRLQASANQGGIDSSTTTDLGSTQHEKLTVQTSDNADVSLEYELVSDNEALSVEIVNGDTFTIARRPAMEAKHPQAEVVFTQAEASAHGPISLTVTENGRVTEAKARTLWHLLMAQPELCAKHLLPLLEMFRPDWRLMETSGAIESQMLRTTEAYGPENLKRWSQWVADLGSDKFAVRQGAERQIRAAGAAVLPYLETLDRKQLDFEQWSRVCNILAADDNGDEDSAANSTSELMVDRELWLTLMDRSQESTRRAAAKQFCFLVGKPIKFDPAATEAVRKAQIEALRIEFAVKAVAMAE